MPDEETLAQQGNRLWRESTMEIRSLESRERSKEEFFKFILEHYGQIRHELYNEGYGDGYAEGLSDGESLVND